MTEKRYKNLGVQMPADDLDQFISCFPHGGASAQVREWIYNYLEASPPPFTKRQPLTEERIRQIFQEEIAKYSTPWSDS